MRARIFWTEAAGRLAAFLLLACPLLAQAHTVEGTTTGPGITFTCPAGQVVRFSSDGVHFEYSVAAVKAGTVGYFNDYRSYEHSKINFDIQADRILWTQRLYPGDSELQGNGGSSQGYDGNIPASCGPANCNAGEMVSYTYKLPQNQPVVASGCFSGCYATHSSSQRSVTLWKPGGVDEDIVIGHYVKTGATCSGPEGLPGYSAAPNGCAQSASGRQVCAAANGCGTVNGATICPKTSAACGTVNGVQFCKSTSGGANCLKNTTTGADSYCISSPASNTELVGSPPGFDNGTAGTPAKPDASFIPPSTGTGDTRTETPPLRLDVFTPGQSAASTYQPGAGGSSGQGAGDGTGSGGSCGGEGQVACRIDESGTPTTGNFSAATEALNSGMDQQAASLESIANSAPITGFGEGVLPTIPTTGSCQKITLQFFGGREKEFPPPFLCTFFGIVRNVLAFFLYIVTAFWIIMSVTKAN